jgi:hypothetical protein
MIMPPDHNEYRLQITAQDTVPIVQAYLNTYPL